MANKEQKAQEIAARIRAAAQLIDDAVAELGANDLNLENYPEWWHDFSEHGDELRNMFVTDFDTLQLMVGEAQS